MENLQPLTIEIKIGDLEKTYELFKTSAPSAYDGFGTFTVYNVGGEKSERIIAVDSKHVEWQTGRNASGLHQSEPVLDDGLSLKSWLTGKLFDRMTQSASVEEKA